MRPIEQTGIEHLKREDFLFRGENGCLRRQAVGVLVLGATAVLWALGCATMARQGGPQGFHVQGGGWLGIVGREAGPGRTEVTDVYVGSPAQEAGVEPGDLIVGVDGYPEASGVGLLAALGRRRPGETLSLRISRIVERVEVGSDADRVETTGAALTTQYRRVIGADGPGELRFRVRKEVREEQFAVPLGEVPRFLRPAHRGQEVAADTREAGWLGVSLQPVGDLTRFGLGAQAGGLRILSVLPGSPAAKAGLRSDDIILRYGGREVAAGEDRAGERFVSFLKGAGSGSEITVSLLRMVNEELVTVDGSPRGTGTRIQETIRELRLGEELRAAVIRSPKQLDVNVTLSARPARPSAGRLPRGGEMRPARESPASPLEGLVREVLARAKLEERYGDLLHRLAEDEAWDDGFRLPGLGELKRNPFRIPGVSGGLLTALGSASRSDVPEALRLLADRILPSRSARPGFRPFPLRTGLSPEEHCEQFARLLEAAELHRRKAFGGLTVGDLEFLGDNLLGFARRWSRDRALSNPEAIAVRGEIDRRVLSLLGYVDYEALFDAAAVIASVLSPDFLEGLRRDLEAEGRDGILASRETALGRVILSGAGSSKYETPAAVIVDLGGDDFYATGAAAKPSSGLPFSLVIDYDGCDRYSSTEDGGQGSGILGVGLLADLAGDDTYLGQMWAQGSGLAGVGILVDGGGRDRYQAREFSQGAGVFGMGLLVDRGEGGDAYSADKMAQGFGGPGAAGLLFDQGGDDRYFASGGDPSSYKDNPGTFQGWSQGCGTGIRCYADWELSRSGGVGILIDGGGADHYEAGTFSQGGGYFYGWGMLLDGGDGDDQYLGTRYAQGFAAHSAVGYFEDQGGNDRYRSEAGVTAGAAWDLSAAVFLDRAGDDVYEGGFFSLGASAHNGFCLFQDLGGRDTYLGTVPGAAGPNDYHGGSSLSVYLTEGAMESGGDQRPLRTRRGGEEAILVRPADSIRIRGSVERLAAEGRWRDVLRTDAEP